MKNFTPNNYKKAVQLIKTYGYPEEKAENIAINAFALYANFRGSYASVEDVIRCHLSPV